MTEFIKAAARPFISVIFAVVLGLTVFFHITVPEWFLALSIPTIAWWFGERALGHVKANNTASLDKLAEKVAEKIKG